MSDAAAYAAEQGRGDNRGVEPGWASPGAARLGRSRRGAVRLLPDRANHAGRVAPGTDPEPNRSGHRSRDDRQHLSMRHLPAHPRRDQDRGKGARMKIIENVSRRRFIEGMFSTGAFVLAARVLPESAWAQTATPAFRTSADGAMLHPSVYLGIQPDGTVFIVTHRSEMGTGIRTTLPMVAADELDADWSRVRIEQGIGDARYGDQNTDGSRSIRDFYVAFRQACASARSMLISAAAAQWKVPASECTASN